MTLQQVPVIDIAPFLGGERDGKARVAAEVKQACEDIGFFVITGHGVDPSVTRATHDVSRRFFDLSLEEKMTIERWADDVIRGYSPALKECLAESRGERGPGDLKESLTVGPPFVPDEPYYHCAEAGQHFVENRWPTRPAELKETWIAYWDAMEQLAFTLMRIFALALDLDEDYFEKRMDRHVSQFRVLNYPDQPDPPLEDQFRASAHSDFGACTICAIEDRPGGLQAMNRDGEWVDVPVVPDAFSINLGDQMQMWTNDQWVSTLHRVINPPRDKANDSRRQSMIFFFYTNYDCIIECFPTCQSDDNPAKYPPVTTSKNLLDKFLMMTAIGASGQRASDQP